MLDDVIRLKFVFETGTQVSLKQKFELKFCHVDAASLIPQNECLMSDIL